MTVINKSEYKDKLREVITEITGIKDFKDDDVFTELGIDSLTVLELIQEIEDEFDILIPEETIEEYFTDFNSVYQNIMKLMDEKE
ncbi:acyl carrier protein [Paucisalibacillus sp. EB02]|uniref:acyl carrier protein n=1 Tax=Paucisalibacillus sp. EB02 TaxID=1347087 RepID=UPI0005AB65B1|nr:acyl carrier protein [Paucisalibacillus sp. EB02]